MEMSQNNILTVTALQQAASAGKANLKANDIEDVDLVLDEIAEQNDQMSQIQDALAQSTMAGVDEDDLEAELDVRCLSRFHCHNLRQAIVLRIVWFPGHAHSNST